MCYVCMNEVYVRMYACMYVCRVVVFVTIQPSSAVFTREPDTYQALHPDDRPSCRMNKNSTTIKRSSWSTTETEIGTK